MSDPALGWSRHAAEDLKNTERRQQEAIDRKPDKWFENETLFAYEKVEPIKLSLISEDGSKERGGKHEVPAPTGDEIRWRMGPFYSGDPLNYRKTRLLLRLWRFWNPERIRDVLVPITARRAHQNTSNLDYLCVNYGKNPHIVYEWPVRGRNRLVNIHIDYNMYLRTYHRDCFDPCRRYQRIWFESDGRVYSTTVAQLHFIYWAWEFGVLHYAEKHLDAINREHALTKDQRKKRKTREKLERGVKQRRTEVKGACTGTRIFYGDTEPLVFFDIDSDEDGKPAPPRKRTRPDAADDTTATVAAGQGRGKAIAPSSAAGKGQRVYHHHHHDDDDDGDGDNHHHRAVHNNNHSSSDEDDDADDSKRLAEAEAIAAAEREKTQPRTGMVHRLAARLAK